MSDKELTAVEVLSFDPVSFRMSDGSEQTFDGYRIVDGSDGPVLYAGGHYRDGVQFTFRADPSEIYRTTAEGQIGRRG